MWLATYVWFYSLVCFHESFSKLVSSLFLFEEYQPTSVWNSGWVCISVSNLIIHKFVLSCNFVSLSIHYPVERRSFQLFEAQTFVAEILLLIHNENWNETSSKRRETPWTAANHTTRLTRKRKCTPAGTHTSTSTKFSPVHTRDFSEHYLSAHPWAIF